MSMLAHRAIAPRTPHSKLRNENSAQIGTRSAFPKTPLPSSKQILETVQSGKQTIGTSNRPRKALLDKTPGTHLKNRGVTISLQTKDGKSSIFLDEKAASASRKSVKQPRLSSTLKTPDVGTQKPHWEVNEADVTEQITVKEQNEDSDEPEYMPPGPFVQPIEEDYSFLMSGKELGETLNELGRTPYHWYSEPPISFDEPAFFIPEEELIVPLRPLPSSSDSDEDEPITPSAPKVNQTINSTTGLRQPTKRAQQVLPSRSAPTRITGAKPLAITARRKSGTTSVVRIPLRSTAASISGSRPTRSSNRTVLGATSSSSKVAPVKSQASVVKGKGRLDSVIVRRPAADPLAHLPPDVKSILEKSELPIDDFRFDVD